MKWPSWSDFRRHAADTLGGLAVVVMLLGLLVGIGVTPTADPPTPPTGRLYPMPEYTGVFDGQIAEVDPETNSLTVRGVLLPGTPPRECQIIPIRAGQHPPLLTDRRLTNVHGQADSGDRVRVRVLGHDAGGEHLLAEVWVLSDAALEPQP